MKNIILSCLLLLISASPSSAQNVHWGGSIDVTFNDNIYDLQADKDNSLVICGQFSGTVDFDPGPGVANMTAAGTSGEDIFVAKYDSVGTYLWSHGFGTGFFNDECDRVAIDTSGNVIITGMWNGTIDFDPSLGNTYNISSNNNSRSRFVAKYDKDGNFIAAVNMGNAVGYLPSSQDGQSGIGTDDDGNVYVCGFYGTTLNVGPGVTLSVSGLSDNFVAKFNPMLQVAWAFRIGSNETEYSQGMLVEPSGKIIALGSFRNTVDFDPGPGSVTLTQTSTTADGYFASYDSSGQLLFVKQLEAGNSATPIAVLRDGNYNIILSGSCTAVMDADPGPGIAPVGTGFNDQAFLATYDSVGNYRWAFALGDVNAYHAFRYAGVDNANNIYVAGNYNPMVDVDPGPGTAVFGNLYGEFVASYDTAGIFRTGWYLQDAKMRVRNDDIYLSGYYYGNVDFDPGPQTFYLQSDTANASWYVLRMHICDAFQPIPVPVTITGACNGDTATFTAAPGATTYNWILPSGLNPVGPTNGQSLSAVIDLVFLGGEVYVSADGGCLNSPYSAVTVIANQPPLPVIFPSGDTLFMVPPTTPAQWYLNNVPIPGATDTFWVATAVGIYTVMAVDSNGCEGVSPPLLFVPSAIEELNGIQFSVYPQPFDNSFTLSIPELNGDVTITVMDLTGRTIYQSKTTNRQTEIPTGKWDAGMYLLRIHDKDGNQSVKLLQRISSVK